ncbi:glycosyltransferase family 4 protein [Thauera propionica]|uniref:glycosyltransferase family 4 protein n=1 Tax=Thauera propionica TaxID=2019431 RepID=UPI0023F2D95C|nr:glycosyltransferase family 4 protein [Thauera propionica]MDD3674571.1 glycosyltransferase family 4 protein [Thauera propionica]
MKICYVLAYRAPNYIRTRSLLAALNSMPRVQCHTAINTRTGLGRYRDTLAQVARIERQYRPDIYILGFRGYELYWPLRRQIGKRPLILDAMMSPSLALAEEDQYGLPGRLASRLIGPIERHILHDADLVLTDTDAHIKAFQHHYQLSATKLNALPVGAVETAPTAPHPGRSHRLRVLFYGSFLPLHGFDIIIQACRALNDLPLDLDFIGANAKYEARINEAFNGSGGALRFRTRRWVPFEQLVEQELPTADLCLGGPFGNTPQARRVITGKTSQSLAQAVPTVIGDTDAGSGFVHQKNCLLVPQGNPEMLAAALLWAHENRAHLSTIGQQGRQLYREHLSLDVVTRRLSEILQGFHS